MAEELSAAESAVERRLHPRLQVMEHATLQRGNPSESVPCVVVDVSLGGLQARGKGQFQPGERVLVSVGPDADGRVSIFAEVKYSVPVGASGVVATGMRVSSEDRRALCAWVDFVRSVFDRQSDEFDG